MATTFPFLFYGPCDALLLMNRASALRYNVRQRHRELCSADPSEHMNRRVGCGGQNAVPDMVPSLNSAGHPMPRWRDASDTAVNSRLPKMGVLALRTGELEQSEHVA